MLIRKLFRTAWRYKAQFLSMTLMVAIGVGVFLGFNIEWKSIEADTSAFFENTNYADFRLYSEMGFSEMDIEAIQKISGVNAATRFLSVNAEVKDTKKSVALMASEDYTVSTMLITQGQAYERSSDGIWLSDQFAEKNDISIGDTMTLSYKGVEINGEVAGLCKSGEMLICTADENQLMPDFETFGFAYVSPEKLEKALGSAFYPQINILSDMTKEEMEEAVSDALGRTIMVTPKEDHISYAGVLSEAEEGKTMGSILPMLFLAIGILTMVTTMHRIAANEKTQIGTLKALGFRDRPDPAALYLLRLCDWADWHSAGSAVRIWDCRSHYQSERHDEHLFRSARLGAYHAQLLRAPADCNGGAAHAHQFPVSKENASRYSRRRIAPLYAKDHAKACDGKTVPLGETVFWNQMEPAGCAPA